MYIVHIGQICHTVAGILLISPRKIGLNVLLVYSRSFMIRATRLSGSMIALRETPLITDSLVRTLMALEEGWNIFNRGKAAHLAGFHTPPLVSLYADISFKESLSTTKYWPESMFQQNLKVAWYCFLESEDTLYFWPWLLVRIAAWMRTTATAVTSPEAGARSTTSTS